MRRERQFSHIHREVRLPKGIDSEHISANLTNGVLHVDVPKLPEKERRAIDIS